MDEIVVFFVGMSRDKKRAAGVGDCAAGVIDEFRF